MKFHHPFTPKSPLKRNQPAKLAEQQVIASPSLWITHADLCTHILLWCYFLNWGKLQRPYCNVQCDLEGARRARVLHLCYGDQLELMSHIISVSSLKYFQVHALIHIYDHSIYSRSIRFLKILRPFLKA